MDFLLGSGGFCGSVVWWISGRFLVGFWWILWFWSVFGGILGGRPGSVFGVQNPP